MAAADLLECPTEQPRSRTGVISLLGGVVSFAGNFVIVPPEASLAPIAIEIAVPASDYMLVDLGVNGQEHWQFTQPVTVTLNYSRCRMGLFSPPVTVWHVDPATGELLEHMGGVDNRLLHRITFTTDHFSGYAIAN